MMLNDLTPGFFMRSPFWWRNYSGAERGIALQLALP
jgi:hypothetical protein